MSIIDFEPFVGKNTRTTDYFISINKAYGIGLSASFCRKHNILAGYDYALLLWSKNQKKLAIKFYKKADKVDGAFAVSKGKHSASIMASSWFKENEMDPIKYADKYDVKEYNDPRFGLLYYIDLSEKK